MLRAALSPAAQGAPFWDSHSPLLVPGPSSPQLLSAEPVSDTAVRLSWQVPEYPNGGITKYIVELQQVGGTSEPQWIDTDSGAETTKIIGGLNASTNYQFRVRANSHVPGEWSQPVKAKTLGDGERGVPAGRGLTALLQLGLRFWVGKE